MVENVVFSDLQDLTVAKCQQLSKENLVAIAELEATASDDPSLVIQLELLKRENALLAALEKALAHRDASGQTQGSGSAQYRH